MQLCSWHPALSWGIRQTNSFPVSWPGRPRPPPRSSSFFFSSAHIPSISVSGLSFSICLSRSFIRAGLCSYVTVKRVVYIYIYFLSVGYCIHAADGFVASCAMCSTFLRCCFKNSSPYDSLHSRSMSVLKWDQSDESGGGVRFSSVYINSICFSHKIMFIYIYIYIHTHTHTHTHTYIYAHICILVIFLLYFSI